MRNALVKSGNRLLKSGSVLFERGDAGFKSGNGVSKTANLIFESSDPLFECGNAFFKSGNRLLKDDSAVFESGNAVWETANRLSDQETNFSIERNLPWQPKKERKTVYRDSIDGQFIAKKEAPTSIVPPKSASRDMRSRDLDQPWQKVPFRCTELRKRAGGERDPATLPTSFTSEPRFLTRR